MKTRVIGQREILFGRPLMRSEHLSRDTSFTYFGMRMSVSTCRSERSSGSPAINTTSLVTVSLMIAAFLFYLQEVEQTHFVITFLCEKHNFDKI